MQTHNTPSGKYTQNNRGEQLIVFIPGEGLIVQNIDSEPTFVTSNRQEVLYLSVSTRYMSEKITNWHVSTKLSCSKHRHIRATLRDSLENDIRRIRNSVEIGMAANDIQNYPLKRKQKYWSNLLWSKNLENRRAEVENLFNRAKESECGEDEKNLEDILSEYI
ncbi:hypothetical protein JTB14_032950 [Gonioctena quinquepunctata]|nr:hypothetical protein JTB14_032950 [Gonioctena quinquepunctata]